MGIAANKFRLLYLTSSKSDIEYKILVLNQKRIALLDQSSSLSASFAQSIFDSGEHSDLYDGQIPGLLPGMSDDSDIFDPSDETPISESQYEAQLAVIHAMDKEYNIEVKKLESFYEAKKTEIESVSQILKKNTEKDYKTFG